MRKCTLEFKHAGCTWCADRVSRGDKLEELFCSSDQVAVWSWRRQWNAGGKYFSREMDLDIDFFKDLIQKQEQVYISKDHKYFRQEQELKKIEMQIGNPSLIKH